MNDLEKGLSHSVGAEDLHWLARREE